MKNTNKLKKFRSLPLNERIIHVHIPKTGGTWLNANLRLAGIEKNYDHSTIVPCIDAMSQRVPVWTFDHSPIVTLHTHSDYQGSHERFKKACKVAIVRNPFDWLVSYYEHVGHGRWANHRGWDDIVNTHNITSFEHFLNHFCDPNKRWYHIWIKRNIFYQIFNQHGEVGVNVILKNENLNEGAKDLFIDLGIIQNRNEIVDIKSNQNKHRKDYRHYYNSEMIDMVNDYLKEELRVFKYDFENSNIDKSYWLGDEFGTISWDQAFNRTKYQKGQNT